MDIEQRVINVIKDVLDIKDEKQIKPEARFIEELNADSLEIVNLIMQFEEEFDIEIPDSDVENRIFTVQDAIDYIKERLNK